LATEVVVCEPKSIQQEIRFFIVDSKIATYSIYKIGDRVHYSDMDASDEVIDFVHGLIKSWEPDIAYVLDIALSEGVPKVLETNSINSSGLYSIDTQKLIMAVEELRND
jgi:hypothetical protein